MNNSVTYYRYSYVEVSGNQRACLITAPPKPANWSHTHNTQLGYLAHSHGVYLTSEHTQNPGVMDPWGKYSSELMPRCEVGSDGGGGGGGGGGGVGVVAPGVPRLVVDGTSLSVFWDPGASYTAATGYDVQYRKTTDTTWTDHTHTTTDTNTTITNLDKTASYIVLVRTKHGINQTSPWSLPATISMTAAAAPGALSATALIPGNQKITALWAQPPTGAHPPHTTSNTVKPVPPPGPTTPTPQ